MNIARGEREGGIQECLVRLRTEKWSGLTKSQPIDHFILIPQYILNETTDGYYLHSSAMMRFIHDKFVGKSSV